MRSRITVGHIIISVIVPIIALALLASCGRGPVGPDPTTCQDSKATNFGGPLPCIYPSPPAQSYVRVIRTIPSTDGAILNSKKEEVSVTVEYGVSQADLDEAIRSGDTIVTMTCASIDGTTPVPICFGRLASGSRGENEHHFGVNLEATPEATQTRYIILYLKWVHDGGLSNQTEREIAKSVFQLIVNWQ